MQGNITTIIDKGGKTLQNIDFKTFINGAGNDLKIAIDDVIGAIITIQADIEKLKIKALKPDKDAAKALLEYIAMEDSKSKENIEALCGREIQKYLRWLDKYSKEVSSTPEQVLIEIIQGDI